MVNTKKASSESKLTPNETILKSTPTPETLIPTGGHENDQIFWKLFKQ